MEQTLKPIHSAEEMEHCPIAKAVRLVGDMWVLLIIRALMGGVTRFSELQDSLGSVSSGTLSQRLKLLESHGIVTRHAFAEIPPRVEYHLTEKGLALHNVIEALGDFGNHYLCGGEDAAE
jgi:DNA-binding HxlR family transcriptional regulator